MEIKRLAYQVIKEIINETIESTKKYCLEYEDRCSEKIVIELLVVNHFHDKILEFIGELVKTEEQHLYQIFKELEEFSEQLYNEIKGE